MKKKDRVCVCLVGAGRMGQIRAPLLYANPDVDLKVVVDMDPAACKAVAERFSASPARSIREALVDHPTIQAVFISTPTFTHVPAIREVIAHSRTISTGAESSAPRYHIFVEKPVAENPVDIAEIFEEAAAAGVKIMCGFQRRFDVSYKAVQEKVAAGDIGTVRSYVEEAASVIGRWYCLSFRQSLNTTVSLIKR